MKIGFFSSEVFPFAKTGGLADVAGALPLALEELGCQVKIFMPLYRGITPSKMNEDFGLSFLGKNIEVIFIRNDSYFCREYLYNTPQGDYPDNLERFNFYCEKALEILKKINFKPDIIHCNDWQTCLVLVYLKLRYKEDPFFKDVRGILTIHNLAYQGYFALDKFEVLRLDERFRTILEIYGRLNLLKAGILTADRVNTVSPTYAQEIQTKEFGCGLEGVLKENNYKLSGILNAIDYRVWNPAEDEYIYYKYDSSRIEGKLKNKLAFQEECNLEKDSRVFLLGMVSRLAEQKGVDIFLQAIPQIVEEAQLVVLGTGEEKYHRLLSDLARRFKKRFALYLKFDEVLAHKIYASADCFLMPSRFEPCGLSQLISFKYLTLPLVKATGGLKDTVIDYLKNKEEGRGFVFSEHSAQALVDCIREARKVFERKEEWLNIQKRVFRLEFSWKETAKNYLKLYET